jgi:hypothetical protein
MSAPVSATITSPVLLEIPGTEVTMVTAAAKLDAIRASGLDGRWGGGVIGSPDPCRIRVSG